MVYSSLLYLLTPFQSFSPSSPCYYHKVNERLNQGLALAPLWIDLDKGGKVQSVDDVTFAYFGNAMYRLYKIYPSLAHLSEPTDVCIGPISRAH